MSHLSNSFLISNILTKIWLLLSSHLWSIFSFKQLAIVIMQAYLQFRVEFIKQLPCRKSKAYIMKSYLFAVVSLEVRHQQFDHNTSANSTNHYNFAISNSKKVNSKIMKLTQHITHKKATLQG